MSELKRITRQDLERFNDLFKGQCVLFDENGLVSDNKHSDSEIVHLQSRVNWNALYHDFLDELTHRDVEVMDEQLIEHYFSVTGEKVLLDQDPKIYILAQFHNVTVQRQQAYELKRAEDVRNVMLEIMKIIFSASSEQEIFNIALQSSIQAIQKSTYGTIMIKEGDYFITAAYEGYMDSVMQLKLPCKESFLSIITEGPMDRFVLVDQDRIIFNEDFIKDVTEGRKLKSMMTGPIYVEGELYGMFSIDSYQPNAFDEKDVDSLAFLARATGYAIEHHRLYRERQARPNQ